MAYYFKKANPTVDLVILTEEDGQMKVLLVKRNMNSEAEPGKWAFPGGFVNSKSKKGELHISDETPTVAAIRELREETSVKNVDVEHLYKIGEFEGGGRDPRDTPEAWSKSHAFLAVVPRELLPQYEDLKKGFDDVQECGLFTLQQMKEMDIAFDHRQILTQALFLMHHSGLDFKSMVSPIHHKNNKKPQ